MLGIIIDVLITIVGGFVMRSVLRKIRIIEVIIFSVTFSGLCRENNRTFFDGVTSYAIWHCRAFLIVSGVLFLVFDMILQALIRKHARTPQALNGEQRIAYRIPQFNWYCE